jgi:hypothetical protein
MQMIGFAVVASVAASAFWTGNDPFVGRWRLDVSRSTIVDDMRVQALGANRYAFNFEGGPTETVVADGTDQPGLPGTTLSVTAGDSRSFHVVRKQDGHIIVSAAWKLSPDGRTLRDTFTSVQPDGSRTTTDYLYKRMAGSSGFAGLWESTTKPTGLELELAILPYEKNGLSFVSPGSSRNVIFDARDHLVAGAKNGMTISGKRRGTRVVETKEKDSGKVERARRFELSADGRVLTETLRTAAQRTADVLVFKRE